MSAASAERASEAVAPHTIRCHRCSKFLGESDRPMEFVGVVRLREDREIVKPPRATWLCKCGWSNIFVPVANVGSGSDYTNVA